MGGLIGVTLAASVEKDRITHLLINDTGPDLSAAGLDRIGAYVGNPPLPIRSFISASKSD